MCTQTTATKGDIHMTKGKHGNLNIVTTMLGGTKKRTRTNTK